MLNRSPERNMRSSQKQSLKLTNSYSSTSSAGFGLGAFSTGGSSSIPSTTIGVEKQRLRSLESRGSIQSRHLNSYQTQPTNHDRAYIGGSQNAPPPLVTTSSSLSNNRWFKDMTKTRTLEDRSRSIGERLPTEEGVVVGAAATPIVAVKETKNKRSKAIQVFVRVRPLNTKEIEGKNIGRRAVRLNSEQNIVIVSGEARAGVLGSSNSGLREEKFFEMNQTFSEDSTNSEIFNSVMRNDIRTSLFEGYNCTCFVYGMTGAGKTYTMFGDICNYLTMTSHVKGLIMLALKEIIAVVKDQAQQANSFVLRMSYLEIYNEQIRDLLSTDASSSSAEDNLMIVEDPQRGVVVPELTEIMVNEEAQVIESIRIGNTRRQMAATGQNEFSSRSHAIITFTIEQTTKKSENGDQLQQQKDNAANKMMIKTSKLCLVDLAGSERAAITENRGIRLQEGANINKSLLALGNCINILSDTSKKGAFVPYRDSKLTRLLKDSLGGNTQTYMIACISPASVSAEETMNTLKYAQRARKITKTVTQNLRTISESAVQAQDSMKYLSLIESMKREIEYLKQQLAIKQTGQQIIPNTAMPSGSATGVAAQIKNGGIAAAAAAAATTTTNKQFVHKLPLDKITNKKQTNNVPKNLMIMPLVQEQTPREVNGFSPVSMAKNDMKSFFSDDIDDEVLLGSAGRKIPTVSDSNYQSACNQQMQQYPLHNLWEDQESFSSSGKSVRISITNTSNNGSVILFKRSPSQLNFTKPSQQHTHNPKNQQIPQPSGPRRSSSSQSLVSSSSEDRFNPVRDFANNNHMNNNNYNMRAATDRGEENAQTMQIQVLSGRFVKNLEENWEIQQSISELQQLQADNESVLNEKRLRLKQLREKLIQWVHENEISEIALGVQHLQDTMNNNAMILQRMQEALSRNEDQKRHLQDEMISTLSHTNTSDHVLKQLTKTCEVLKTQKTDLHNANIEIKQQHNFIHSQFMQKVQQIKSMQVQIKEMQLQLDQKNSIISQNQMLLLQLLPANKHQQIAGADVNAVDAQSSLVPIRSTSQKNARNKKLLTLEKTGYFDFKNKNNLTSTTTTEPSQTISAQSQQEFNGFKQQPVSPSGSLQPPHHVLSQSTKSNDHKISYFPTKKFSSSTFNKHQQQQQQQLSQSIAVTSSQKQYTAPNESTTSSTTAALYTEFLSTQPNQAMTSSSSPNTQSSARIIPMYNKSVGSGTTTSTSTALLGATTPATVSTSYHGRKSIQTHREKYPLNKYNSSSISYSSTTPSGSTGSAVQQEVLPITNKHSHSMATPSTLSAMSRMQDNYNSIQSSCQPTISSPSHETRTTTEGRSSLSSLSSPNHPMKSAAKTSTQFNGNAAHNANKDLHLTKGIHQIRTEYREYMNQYRLSTKEDEPNAINKVKGAHDRNRTASDQAYFSNNNNASSLNNIPALHTMMVSIPSDEMIKEDGGSASFTRNEDDLNSSVSEFLKTDEFPESDLPQPANSCVYSKIPHSNQSIESYSNIFATYASNMSSSNQPQQKQQAYSMPMPVPVAVNFNLKRESVTQQNTKQPAATVAEIMPVKGLCDITEKESNIVTPENSVSIHKIDLFRSQAENPPLNKREVPSTTSNLSRSIVSQHKQYKSPLRSTKSNDKTSAIHMSINESIASGTMQQQPSSSQERNSLNSISNFQRVKTLGSYNIPYRLDESTRRQSVSPPPKSMLPVKKVNSNVMEVIEKQKQKQSEEHERHLYLSNIATDILNNPTSPPPGKFETKNSTVLVPSPSLVTAPATASSSSSSSGQIFFNKSTSPSVRQISQKQLASPSSSTLDQLINKNPNNQLAIMRASRKTQISSISLNQNNDGNTSKVTANKPPPSLFPQQI